MQAIFQPLTDTPTTHTVKRNGNHGLRRSNADKRKAVETLLKDAEWAMWSQQKIAKECGVSVGLVSKLLSELSSIHGEKIKPSTRLVERNGKTYAV